MGTFYNEDYNYSLKHYGVPGMRWKRHQYTGTSSYDFNYEDRAQGGLPRQPLGNGQQQNQHGSGLPQKTNDPKGSRIQTRSGNRPLPTNFSTGARGTFRNPIEGSRRTLLAEANNNGVGNRGIASGSTRKPNPNNAIANRNMSSTSGPKHVKNGPSGSGQNRNNGTNSLNRTAPRHDSRPRWLQDLDKNTEGIQRAAGRAARDARRTANRAARTAGRYANRAARTAGRYANRAARNIGEFIDHAIANPSEASRKARETVQDTYNRTRRNVSRAANTANRHTRDARNKVEDAINQTRRNANRRNGRR